LGLALIQQLDEVKKQLVSQLKIPAKEIEDIQVLNVIDSYIPLVQTLFESIKRSQEAVRLDSKLAFQWFGGIGATDTCFECVDLIFEVLMCTVTKSVLHSRVAMNMIASTPAGSLLPLAAAGEHLKLAMGVLNSMQAILPCWTATPEMKRPLELFEPVRKALVHIFSGLASKLAVIKAIQKEGGTAPILMSKLCIFVSVFYR
jgi:hypothetical protein